MYRVSQKNGNSVTNSKSSLLWISIVIPNFKTHNIIRSARVYFMNTVNGCKDVSIMYPQDNQWRHCLYTAIFLFYQVQPNAVKTKQTKCEHGTQTHSDYSFLSRYHYTKSNNYLKRRYRIRHWIPMFIGHPVGKTYINW